MSFATAFLGADEEQTEEDRIGANVEVLLQAVSPEWSVGPEFPCVQASNLCFGVPMNWALGDGKRSGQIRGTLRTRLGLFEPRLTALSQVDLHEDTQDNAVTFYIAGATRSGGKNAEIEIEKKLSRLDQFVKEAR